MKYISVGILFTFLVNIDYNITVCGKLETADKIYSNNEKIVLPPGILLDIIASRSGGNVLISDNGVKKVYYIGNSTN